jgi:hypothetical protein
MLCARQAPVVRAPFVLLPSYAAAWQLHSLLPGAGARHVLPLGERAVLTASLRAEGDVTVRAMQLELSPGWQSRVSAERAPLVLSCAL